MAEFSSGAGNGKLFQAGFCFSFNYLVHCAENWINLADSSLNDQNTKIKNDFNQLWIQLCLFLVYTSAKSAFF